MPYSRIKATSTISELILAGKQEPFIPENLHLKTVIPSNEDFIIINLYSIIDRYIEDLKSIMVDVEMSDKEFEKYRYKPKLLCVELYDNIDLAPLILRMNNMLSVLEFNKKNIKLFKTSVISYLNEMKNLEKSRLDENESKNNKIING